MNFKTSRQRRLECPKNAVHHRTRTGRTEFDAHLQIHTLRYYLMNCFTVARILFVFRGIKKKVSRVLDHVSGMLCGREDNVETLPAGTDFQSLDLRTPNPTKSTASEIHCGRAQAASDFGSLIKDSCPVSIPPYHSVICKAAMHVFLAEVTILAPIRCNLSIVRLSRWTRACCRKSEVSVLLKRLKGTDENTGRV